MIREEEQELFGYDEVSRQAKRGLLTDVPARVRSVQLNAPEHMRQEQENLVQRLREAGAL